MWEEEYYIFDSNTISESDFEEKLEYQGYKAFEDSMMGDEVVNRLNEQHETIYRLQENINELLSVNVEAELLKENEQLKTTIQQLRTDNTKQKKLLNTTMKENEHIKQTIKDMINTERTELGKMTLRHLWRQIQ